MFSGVLCFGYTLGRGFDLLTVLQPFDLDVGIHHLTLQHDLLTLIHRVAGVEPIQESWRARGRNGEKGGLTTHQAPFSCFPPSPASPEVKSRPLIHVCHPSNAPRLLLYLLTFTGLDLDLHLFQTFQHAPQVSDAILKGDFLILAGMGALKQFPHIYLFHLFLRLLLPASRGQ